MRMALSLLTATAVALVTASLDERARAQGVHIGAGRLHVDVGNPHHHPHRGYPSYGRYGYSQPKQFSWNTHFRHFSGGGYGPTRHRAYYHQAPHYDWHDTTHYDYHPGEYVPHFNHYHYVPGHYDLHRSGHWDAHH